MRQQRQHLGRGGGIGARGQLPVGPGAEECRVQRVAQSPVLPAEEGPYLEVAVLGARVRVGDHAAPLGVLARAARLDQPGEELDDGGQSPFVLREAVESGQADRALSAGARAPGFGPPSATGRTITLDELLAEGPVVLIFYRGAGCPYCNIALRSPQQHHDAIAVRGARLVAVSPQTPDESLSLTEEHGLAFHVLSDVGSGTARQYGLAFDLPDDLAAVYDKLGFDLQRVNGGHARTLPLPATYVIDRDRTVRWAFVDTDYTRRVEPADILTALDALR